MADLPTITWTSGVPDTGQTGTVMTVSNITDRIGEVQASPTANTMLDRLKTLNSSLSDKSQFAKITDGTDTLLVDSHGSAQTTLLDSSGNAVTFNANGQATAANSAPVVIASDRQNSVSFYVSMTTDTGIYASGDLIADTQILNGFFNKTDGRGVINSINIVERDAQGAAYYILFHLTSTSMGTENSAPNISDANAAAGIQGIISVATTDFVTVSGTKVACIRNIGLPVQAVSGTDDLYVSILNSTGTPTYAGGTIDLYVGGLLD